MPEQKTKILIADDSALMRRTLRKMLENRGFEIIGTARDGEDVIEKAEQLKPDAITLDINMPRMDGLTALRKLIKKHIAPIVMVSSLTQEGASTTMRALEMGAFDCVGKPDGTVTVDMSSVENELERKLRSAVGSGLMKRLRRDAKEGREPKGEPEPTRVQKTPLQKASVKEPQELKRKKIIQPEPEPEIEPEPEKKIVPIDSSTPFKAIAIGISTGGPKTIFDVLPLLPANLNAAIFLVQHMPPSFTSSFAQRIDRTCPMRCVEVRSGLIVEPGTIYLGRGGYHLTFVKKSNNEVVIRTPSRPQHLFIPSVDVMMDSAFNVYGKDIIGVLMTGMGDDGANTMVKICQSGGFTIAESEESAIVWGMPGEAVARGGAKVVKPSWEIASEILRYIKKS